MKEVDGGLRPDGIIGVEISQEKETTVMKKNRTKPRSRKARSCSKRSAPTRRLGVVKGDLSPRRTLLDVVLRNGFDSVIEMLEEDRERLCGPSRRWQADRRHYRHGYDEGRLVYGGRKVKLPKPRVRSVEGQEIELPSWRQFSEEDPLDDRALEQMLAGVSTRGYERSLEAVPEELAPSGTSRSSVSRRFVALTSRKVREFLSRSLGELDIVSVLIDGKGLGEHVLLTALGIDRDGQKRVLGVAEGSTESEAVCRSLLHSLVDRGLAVERARLFVIDGGKGVRAAIRKVFGEWALIQRCQVHKLRNVLDHLPEGKRAWVRAAIRRAWRSKSAKSARRKLIDLARQLEVEHPGASKSLLEGLNETLTILKLGVSKSLSMTVRSTNPIENLHGKIQQVARNVKRWRGGSMALRWTVTGLIEASKKFRRVRGYRDIPALVAEMERLIETNRLDAEQEVA